MKRLSFFLVVIVLLAGVPSLAASPQSEFLQSFFDNPDPPPGSSFEGFGTESSQLQNLEYVGIPSAYVSTDPSDPSSNSWSAPDGYEIVEYHFAYIMCCTAHSASSGSYTAAGLTGFGELWLDGNGATSVGLSISSNGVPGFSEAALTGAYIRSVAEPEPPSLLGFTMSFPAPYQVDMNLWFDEAITMASLTSHPGSCTINGGSLSCSATVSDEGEHTFSIEFQSQSSYSDTVNIVGELIGKELYTDLPVDEMPDWLDFSEVVLQEEFTFSDANDWEPRFCPSPGNWVEGNIKNEYGRTVARIKFQAVFEYSEQLGRLIWSDSRGEIIYNDNRYHVSIDKESGTPTFFSSIVGDSYVRYKVESEMEFSVGASAIAEGSMTWKEHNTRTKSFGFYAFATPKFACTGGGAKDGAH